MPDEEVQELGREGVGQVKAWLEATTWLHLPFNAYEDGARCKVAHLDGSKKFDLRGYFYGEKKNRRHVTVECKRYSSPGGQTKEFNKFLAIAYSYTRKQIKELGEWDEDFIWVTFHPFALGQWPKLVDHTSIKAALEEKENEPLLGGDGIDDELVRRLADRIWLLVLHEKQLGITLTAKELKKVMTVLKREGDALWSH